MKKFTKITLIIAAILAGIGIVFCGIATAMSGGFAAMHQNFSQEITFGNWHIGRDGVYYSDADFIGGRYIDDTEDDWDDDEEDDDTKDDEVMFGIIHLIEQLQGEEYLKKIAICTPDMKEAHDWAMTLNKRIINSQKYFEKYIEIIGDLEKEYKEKILKLLVDVKNDNPKRFGDKINMLIERTV